MEFKQPGNVREVGRIVDLFKPFGNYSLIIKSDFAENQILVFQFDQGMSISLKCSNRVADFIHQNGILDIIKYFTIIRYAEDNDWKLRIAFNSQNISGVLENPDEYELKKYGIPCTRVLKVV